MSQSIQTQMRRIKCRNCGSDSMMPASRPRQNCEDCGEPLARRGGFEWGILIPLGLVLLTVGVGFGLWDYQKADRLARTGVKVVAEPTAWRTETRSGVTQAYIKYKFQIPGSDMWYHHLYLFGLGEFWTSVDDKELPAYQHGKTLTVCYDPSDPTNNCTPGAANLEGYADGAVFACVGVLLICKSSLARVMRRRHVAYH